MFWTSPFIPLGGFSHMNQIFAIDIDLLWMKNLPSWNYWISFNFHIHKRDTFRKTSRVKSHYSFITSYLIQHYKQNCIAEWLDDITKIKIKRWRWIVEKTVLSWTLYAKKNRLFWCSHRISTGTKTERERERESIAWVCSIKPLAKQYWQSMKTKLIPLNQL